jgi:hypothetical protein
MTRKTRKSSFRGKVSDEAQRQKRESSSYGYLSLPKDINMFSPKPGSRIKMDIMPYVVTDKKHPNLSTTKGTAEEGSLWYKRPFYAHRGIGADNNSVVCLRSIGKRCPICDYRTKLQKEGAEKEELDALRSSLRNLYVVIPLDSADHKEELHIMDISQFVFQKLLIEELEENEEYEVFPDLEEGYTLKVRWESKSIGTGNPYAQANRIDFLDRESAYDEKILDDVPDLDKVLNIMTFDELNALFLQIEDEDDGGGLHEDTTEDEPVEKEKPVRKTRKKYTKKEKTEKEPVEKEKKEEPVKRTRRTRKPVEKTDDNPCPFGHKFGVDTDEKDGCATCDKWDDCMDEKEKV